MNSTLLKILNSESVQPDGTVRYFDTLVVIDDEGTEVDALTIEASEDEQPYRDALTAAGWAIIGTDRAGNWTVTESLSHAEAVANVVNVFDGHISRITSESRPADDAG